MASWKRGNSAFDSRNTKAIDIRGHDPSMAEEGIPWPDSEYRKIRSMVRAAFFKWARVLGLRYWDCRVDYRRIPFPPHAQGGVTAAKCHCKWEYRMVTVEVSLIDLSDLNQEQIEDVVIHELLHALVHEMREDDPDCKHEEAVVTGLTRAIRWTYNEGWNDRKRHAIREGIERVVRVERGTAKTNRRMAKGKGARRKTK